MRYAVKAIMKKQKNYDKKVKQTRILLSDYLLLKGFARSTGVSMSEALHKLIVGLKPGPGPVTQPVSQSVLGLTPSVALRHKPSVSAIATNGSKGAAFRIKVGGGVKYE